MSNLKFKNAINRVPQNVPPIWCMRQAGRYHQHYQQLKKKYTFEQLCKNPELAAEVAMGPIEEFDFDVSILFSDILFPLEALGLNLQYNPAPVLSPLLLETNLSHLKSTEEAVHFLEFQAQAVKATRERLPKDKSLIGFVGGVWTLFTYAMEGAHKGNLLKSKNNMDLFIQFSQHLTPVIKANIQMQLDAGAEVVMIFDTAAGELASSTYQKFVAPILNDLADNFSGQVAYYGKGLLTEHYLSIYSPKWAGFGFDHRWSLDKILHEFKGGFVQGNFDQSLLFSDPSKFSSVLKNYLMPIRELSLEDRAGWVCGLGHGVLPQTPEVNVKNFVQIVREVFND